MDQKLLETLEFPKIIEELAKRAQSSLGKERCRELKPAVHLQEIEDSQEETEQALRCILEWGNPPLFGIYPLKQAVHRAKLGGVLTMEQLLEISESLRVSRALIQYVAEAQEGDFVDRMRQLFTQKGLEEEISRSILSAEEMADTASHTLFQIRRTIKQKQDRIKDLLNHIMMGHAQAGHLRENLITIRQGRFVLPVKAEYKNAVRGIVHDQSGSGATLFIEPLAVVNLNNEIRQLEVEEQEEIQRILADLSQEVGTYAEELSLNEEALVSLDFAFAKARYSLDIQGSRPVFSEDRSVDLHQARHPLLGKNVVPIDLRLGDEFNTLIITGPNTGGKTVTLKTLGLMELMGQSGLQIPCASPSKLGVFSQIFADIGDRQSIEMSLSTFSASMTNIVDILNRCEEDSLILFDELGAGTDPTEGAALAMAILQDMTGRGIRTVATTHYSELKLFAIRELGVQNASVEFNVKTLSPTYRLMIGLPGRSNAFEISKRLGLPDSYLQQASQHLDSENVQFEDVLSDIEENRRAVQKERREMERMRSNYEKKLQEMKKQLENAETNYQRQREKVEQEAQQIVWEARETAKKMIREAKQAKAGDRPSLDRALNSIHEQSKGFDRRVEARPQKRPHRPGPKNLKTGESVRILSLNQEGVIVQGPDKNGDVLVQMGILKVNSNVKDLVRVAEKEEEGQKSTTAPLHLQKVEEVKTELDLRGERFEAAMDLVDKYLDDAVLAGLSQVRLIHGKGTGALRKGIHDRLKKDRRVHHYELASLKEGGAGVTVVQLQ